MKGYSKNTTALLATMLLFVLMLCALPVATRLLSEPIGGRAEPGSRYDVYHNSTWTVSTDTFLEDQLIYLGADLIIDPGVEFTLQNSTVEMDLDADGKYSVQLGAGSVLTMENSSILNKTFRRHGFYASGAILNILNSTLRGCGGEAGAKGTKGVEIVNSQLTARSSDIIMGDYGVYSTNGDVDIEGGSVSSHVNHGIYAERGTLRVNDSLVTSNLKTGIWSRFADEQLSGVAYKKGLMENNEMDLRVDRELTVRIRDTLGASLPEVDVSIINNRSVRTDLNTGPSASPVTFQLTWYTLHGADENIYYPYQAIALKTGFERMEEAVVLGSNEDRTYTLYPEGWFDSDLSAHLRTAGGVLEYNETSWAEVNISNSGYPAKNVTVELMRGTQVVDSGWLELVDKEDWMLLNLTFTVAEGLQNLSVMVDPDGNATEKVLKNNGDWKIVEGIERPGVMIYGPRKVFLNSTYNYTASVNSSDLRLEYRFNVSGSLGNWSAGPVLNITFNSTAAQNISAQARIANLLGGWSADVVVDVFVPKAPVAVFEAVLVNPDPEGPVYRLNATGSFWYKFEQEEHTGLRYIWMTGGDGGANLEDRAVVDLARPGYGDFEVSLFVIDPVGGASNLYKYNYTHVNSAPLAGCNFSGGVINATLPFTLSLSAGNTTDPDTTSGDLTYQWEVYGYHGSKFIKTDYTGETVDIEFTRPGEYTIDLRVLDNAGGEDNLTLHITINDAGPKDSEGSSLRTVVCVLGVVVVIIIIVAVIIFIGRNPEKIARLMGRGLKVTDSHLKLNKGKRQDFLIIKHPRRDLYRKYELYNVLDDPEHTALCVVWESEGDTEWRIVGSLAGAKETVIADINDYLDRDTGMKYGVDYWGNGKIISRSSRDSEKEVPKGDGKGGQEDGAAGGKKEERSDGGGANRGPGSGDYEGGTGD